MLTKYAFSHYQLVSHEGRRTCMKNSEMTYFADHEYATTPTEQRGDLCTVD